MREPAAWMDPLALQYNSPEELYAPDNYQAAKHLGDVLMLRTQEEAVPGDEEETKAAYTRAARTYREAEARAGAGDLVTAAVANRGVALLLSGDRAGAIEAFRRLVRPPGEPSDEETPVAYDEHSPLFRLNLGWAHELKGEPEQASEQYLAAVRSDPTFYPTLNDLGILAATEGRADEAKGYFRAALDAKPGYDRALFNLGVALLRDGPRGFLAG